MNELMKIDGAKNKFKELKNQFCEMGQLKSNFDIEKFTIATKGNFIAHQFHMLMRQYSLTLYELRRMVINIEELNRKILKIENIISSGKQSLEFTQIIEGSEKIKYYDLELENLKNERDLAEVTIQNKYKSCEYYEICRQELIKKNGNIVPTNEQYQAEEPEYWKWNIGKMALHQIRERQTGIKEGIWMNIDYLEMPETLNREFQVDMLDKSDNLNIDEIVKINLDCKDKLERFEVIKQLASK